MNKNKKKIVSIFLISVFFISGLSHSSKALLTDPDDLSKGVKLGLDLATATAENKSLTEGAKDVLQKEFDDWTWNYVVGNYEKLIFQNAEAELPDFKGKIDKIQEIIGRIETIATQLGAGNYDEAAFTAVDHIVSTVDHPVVSVLWASVKLAYESHKLVQSTGAALQIESLYGHLENDRRLRGTDRGDGLKLFEMNATTVDYFYNKYLITDETTRSMMKDYVKVRLGEDFPEQSYWQSFTNITAIGSGVDHDKNYELEELEANKNNARRWIAALLKDLNLQAQQRYAEVRARQQKAEFDKFVEQFKYLDRSLPEIIAHFKNLKKIAAEKNSYPEFLAKSKAQRQATENEFSKLLKTDLTKKQKLSDSAWSWQLQCLTYSSRALYIGEKQLGNFIAEERKAWNDLKDRIDKDLKIAPAEIQQVVIADAGSYENKSVQIGRAYFSSNLSPYIKPFEWEHDIEALKTQYLDLLNKGEWYELSDVGSKIGEMEKGLRGHYR